MEKFFKKARLKPKDIRHYQPFAKRSFFERLVRLGNSLKGLSVLHLNSTSCGGGVAEILNFQVPLERSLGIESNWLVINNHQNDFFFVITKKMHNLLQGQKGFLTENEKKLYLRHNRRGFDGLRAAIKSLSPDIVIVHDPQPLSLVDSMPPGLKKVFRLHIDLSRPDRETLEFIRPFVEKFDFLVVSNSRFRPRWFGSDRTAVIYPAIDPLVEKNRHLSQREVGAILARNKLNLAGRAISQISRFDPWKDPIGVIKVFRRVRRSVYPLKLVLMGAAASDDPESREIFEEVKEFKKDDKDIILVTSHNDLLVNAIQRRSDVVLQKSLREGFGLTVAEAMWKGRPVVGGRTLGISRQIEDGKNGFLVSSIKEAVERTTQLLEDRELAKRIGKEAREAVRENFLAPKMVYDHLKLYDKLSAF